MSHSCSWRTKFLSFIGSKGEDCLAAHGWSSPSSSTSFSLVVFPTLLSSNPCLQDHSKLWCLREKLLRRLLLQMAQAECFPVPGNPSPKTTCTGPSHPLGAFSTQQLYRLTSVNLCFPKVCQCSTTSVLCSPASSCSIYLFFWLSPRIYLSSKYMTTPVPHLSSLTKFCTQMLFLSITFASVSVHPDFGLAFLDELYLNKIYW